MPLTIYDQLFYYSTPPNNYTGTTIFISYILLALYATLSIISSLYTQCIALFHPSTPPAKTQSKDVEEGKAARQRHIKIYALLGSISFATLSYHMLFFLITHYFNWAGHKTWSLEKVEREKLAMWMLDSTLFQDFARELVQEPAGMVWTQLAILSTWGWNLWMGRKAREHHLAPSTLWKFILLSQILPISFTAVLFLIQLHLHIARQSLPSSSSHTPSSLNNHTKSLPHKPLASPVLPTILLNLALLSLPSLHRHTIFIPLVLFSRLILVLPHLGVLKLSAAEMRKCAIVTVGCVAAFHVLGRKELWLSGERKRVLREGGYAVRALGWDALLGMGVAGVLGWGGGL